MNASYDTLQRMELTTQFIATILTVIAVIKRISSSLYLVILYQ